MIFDNVAVLGKLVMCLECTLCCGVGFGGNWV